MESTERYRDGSTDGTMDAGMTDEPATLADEEYPYQRFTTSLLFRLGSSYFIPPSGPRNSKCDSTPLGGVGNDLLRDTP